MNPVSNWFFNIASSLVLGFVAGFIIDRILEPRLNRQGIGRDEITEEGEVATSGESAEQMRAELTPAENKGLIAAVIAAAVLTAIVLAATLAPASPWRNEDGGFLPKSPPLDSIVFLVVAYFIVLGLTYGIVVGTLRKTRDAVAMMTESLKEMLALRGARLHPGQLHRPVQLVRDRHLDRRDRRRRPRGHRPDRLPGGSRLHLAGQSPEPVHHLRLRHVGDHGRRVRADVRADRLRARLHPGRVPRGRLRHPGHHADEPVHDRLCWACLRKYEPGAGLGSLMARMSPFVVPFWIVWTVILAVFFFADLPLGPGNGIFLG
uniref:AbgT family transporter n=1 Tax=Brachybacterium sp. GPGPB12 TaxID=3023517 RepID=UPI0040497698